MRVGCINCKEFFEPDEAEVLDFIKIHADLDYLHRIKIPPQYKRKFTSGKSLVLYLLLAHCPYCREVKFGHAIEQRLPNENISRDRYLRHFYSELTKQAGFHIEFHEDEPVELIDDED